MNHHYSHNNMSNRVPKLENPLSDGRRSGVSSSNGKRSNSVTIDDVMQQTNNFNENSGISNNSVQPRYDEEKLPLFLIKLWNIVEDPNIQNIVHWDESGASFHISDPYSFCRNVLPHYFKHNNLNSLIRQLNMYGFRKMTPLNQGGLTRTESDQDHLEFSHPFFVQNHPELLANIKRKQSTKTEDKQASVQTQIHLDLIMQELRTVREKYVSMENAMNSVKRENRQLWEQVSSMRQQQTKQTAVVKKLFHFLFSVIQPNLTKRVTKRGYLAIDDFGGSNSPSTKRQRTEVPGSSRQQNYNNSPNQSFHSNIISSNNFAEMLDVLQREFQEPHNRRMSQNGGPLIADVTDELAHSPQSVNNIRHNRFSSNQEAEGDINGVPNVSVEMPSPTNSYNGQGMSNDQRKPRFDQQFGPADTSGPYMGSGPLTADITPIPDNRRMSNERSVPDSNINRKQPKRGYKSQAPYSDNSMVATYRHTPQIMQHDPNMQGSNTYGQKQLVKSNNARNEGNNEPRNNLNSLSYNVSDESNDGGQEAYSPTLIMSPSLERQLSSELQTMNVQEYLNGVDFSIDNCRDLLNSTDWDHFDFVEDDYSKYDPNAPQLALENTPQVNNGSNEYPVQNDNMATPVPPLQQEHTKFDQFNPNGYQQVPENYDQFPSTPELLTPGSSPSRI